MDVKELCKIYKNAAVQEQYINESNRTLECMTYRNDRAMEFDKFVAKFVEAFDNLEKHERSMHNDDVVDIIFKNMTNPDQCKYVTALKVQFQRQPKE